MRDHTNKSLPSACGIAAMIEAETKREVMEEVEQRQENTVGGGGVERGGAETGARREEMKRIGSYCLSGFGSSSLFTRDNDEFQSSGEVFGKTPPRPGACAH